MFNDLKNQIANEDAALEMSMFLSEMADEDGIEDAILDSIVIPKEEETKIEAMLAKIPDTALVDGSSIDTDEGMIKAMKNVPDPTIEQLLNDDDN